MTRTWLVVLALTGCGGLRTASLPPTTAGHANVVGELAGCAADRDLDASPGPTGALQVRLPEARVQFVRAGNTGSIAVMPAKGLDSVTKTVVVDEAIALGRALWTCADQRAAEAVAAKKAERAEDRERARAPGTQAPGDEETKTVFGGGGFLPGVESALLDAVKDEGTPGTMTPVAPSDASAPSGPSDAPAPSAASEAFADMEPCARLVQCNVALAEELCKGADTCDFEIKVSGNDPQACADAMTKVDDMLSMARMFKPNAKKPAACP